MSDESIIDAAEEYDPKLERVFRGHTAAVNSVSFFVDHDMLVWIAWMMLILGDGICR